MTIVVADAAPPALLLLLPGGCNPFQQRCERCLAVGVARAPGGFQLGALLNVDSVQLVALFQKLAAQLVQVAIRLPVNVLAGGRDLALDLAGKVAALILLMGIENRTALRRRQENVENCQGFRALGS